MKKLLALAVCVFALTAVVGCTGASSTPAVKSTPK
jgi:hypothetical protein